MRRQGLQSRAPHPCQAHAELLPAKHDSVPDGGREGARLIEAVPEHGQGLVAQQRDEAGQVLQLLVRADADAQAADRAHPVLQCLLQNFTWGIWLHCTPLPAMPATSSVFITSAASHMASFGAPLSRTHSTLALPACPARQQLGQEQVDRWRTEQHFSASCHLHPVRPTAQPQDAMDGMALFHSLTAAREMVRVT